MSQLSISVEDRHIISNDMAHHYRILPKAATDSSIELYIDDRFSHEEIRDELELFLGKHVIFHDSPTDQIEKALALHYRKERENHMAGALNIDKDDFLETLFSEAKSLKSSDIHFEVYEHESRIRFRIDGQLIERYRIEKDNYLELVNKVKIRSKLNITEKRLPQDGRIRDDKFDIRVSILPTLFGEKIVMRILGNDASNIDLKSLGFGEDELGQYLEAVRKPNGIVLISGPTGSGKTTTLYATLKLLNDTKRNIVTVEDPIEYTLKGINQVQLREDIGLTFSSALKSFLRQDPDIIMLGEIRDPETALMAIRASLTGHLVLSTIHTNSAVGTISRLTDMGIPSYLISETLNISVAQRLLRKLCPDCRKKTDMHAEDFPRGYQFPYEIGSYYKAGGCNTCYHTGYKNRTAIYEMITIDPDSADAIKNNSVVELLNSKTYRTLADKAFDLLAQGETSLEEIYPVLINA